MRYSFLAILFLSPGLFAIEPPAAGLPRLSGFCCSVSTLSCVGFISGYSSAHGQPAWVFHEIRSPVFKSKRSGNFRSDSRLMFPIPPSVFNHSGFDRGHMAPAHDIGAVFGSAAQRESFLMSNISPQGPTLNRKIWRNIESWCWSTFSASTTTAIVFSGPVFDKDKTYLGRSSIELPDAFFKVILYQLKGNLHMVAFVVPADASSNEITSYVSTVDKVEEITGFDFFPSIPLDTQITLEARREGISPLVKKKALARRR
jgi:endonuclease G